MYYCDKCGKPATSLTWIEINGQRLEQHLCAECASQNNDFDNFIEPMIGEFLDFPMAFARRKPSKRIITCPVCGYTSRDFLRTGRLNCPECYKYFGVLDTNNENFEVKNPYPIEKIKLRPKESKTMSELDNLKMQLKSAVDDERYEDAAALKRQIDNIEGKKE